MGNRTFLCKEVKDNSFDGNGGGCCLGGNENLPCDLVKESALSRRKRYTARRKLVIFGISQLFAHQSVDYTVLLLKSSYHTQ